jgi:hypothetical protein
MQRPGCSRVRVTGFEMKDSRIIAVKTNQGDIARARW